MVIMHINTHQKQYISLYTTYYCTNIVLFVHISIFRKKRKHGIIYHILSTFKKNSDKNCILVRIIVYFCMKSSSQLHYIVRNYIKSLRRGQKLNIRVIRCGIIRVAHTQYTKILYIKEFFYEKHSIRKLSRKDRCD